MKRLLSIRRVVLFFSMLLLVLAPSLRAQSAGTGALAGTITDPTGAVIPNVTVTLTSADTNQTRTVTTAADGTYKFSLLPPGTYKIRFAATGFKTAEVGGVAINVTETPVLNRSLEVGQQTEEVTVEASAETLQTATSSLGTTVGARAATALPLTTRNYTQILGMSAGANVSVNNASLLGKGSQDVSVNGANVNQNNYQMDGVNIDNFAGAGLGADSGIYVGIGIPNPDALQEFKIQTSTYDASYGRNPGANVNVVTKSGTNQYHGSLFEFFRNRDLNAVDFFRNRGCGLNPTLCAQSGGVRQVLNQNQFGGTFGMPIKKDKLFFFFSYQESRQLNGVGTQGYSTPTLPPIPAGDRSTAAFQQALGAAMCPANHPGSSFTTVAGGVQVACDGSNISPVALNYIRAKLPNGQYYIPSSGTAGFATLPFSDPAKFTEHQAVANLDYLLTPKQTLSARFFTTQDPELISFSNAGLVELPGTPANGLYANTNGVLKLTSILTSAMVNEARISVQRNLAAFNDTDPFTNPGLGITPINPAIPVVTPITINGQMNLGGGIGDDVFDPTNQGQVSDTISWSHDKHTLRAGFEYEHIEWDITYEGIERGGLQLQSFPDFLIGRAGCPPGQYNSTTGACGVTGTTGTLNSNISQCQFCVRSGPTGIVHGYRSQNIDWFVQDDYKVSNKLTLNLGLRWEYDGTLSDVYGNLTNLWLSQLGPNSAVPTTPGQTAANLLGYVVPSNYSKFYGAPPAGVLQSSSSLPIQGGVPKNNFAPRFGFAYQAASKLVIRGGLGLFYDRVGGNQFVHSVEQGNPYAVTLDYSGTASNPYSLATPFPAGTLGFASRWANVSNLTTSGLNLPFLDQTLHTPLTRQYNINLQYEFLPSWVMELGFVGSSGINQTDYNHNYNSALLASPTNPVNGQTANTVQNVAFRVPYLGYQPAGLQGTGFDGIYNYNSLQAIVRKQLSHGLTLQGSYTFSKNLTDLEAYSANYNNPTNLGQQYGPAYFNRPQRFVFNYSWDLPFGHPKGVVGKLAEGWVVSGVTVVQDGTPLTFTDAKAGSIYGLNGANATVPGLTSVTFGAVNYGRAQLCPGATYGSIPTNGGVESRLGGVSGGSGYFNNAGVFCAAPVIGNGTDFGNSGVGIALGPGQFNWDVSLVKTTRVGGIRENATLQIRSEFFNAFNHPQFNNPGTAISTPTTYGVITSESVSPRLIQFAMKYTF